MVINAMIFTMVGDVFTADQRLADPIPDEYYNGSWKKQNHCLLLPRCLHDSC